MPSLLACTVFMPAVSLPSSMTVPVVGWYTLVSRLNTVVLPAPLGPIRPAISVRADGQVEVLHGLQAAELDAQVARFQHGALVHIPLGDDAVAGHGHHLRFRIAAYAAGSCRLALLSRVRSCRSAERIEALEPHAAKTGLLVASITRISTTAYTSMR